MEDFLGKTIDMINKATEKDREENYAEALQLYLRAFEFFQICQKHEKMPQRLEMIKSQMQQYVARAEEIKKALQNEHAASNSPGGSAKGGDGGGETDEMKKLRKNMESTIVVESPNVQWEDVVGLQVAKESLKETVIIPITHPQLFKGGRQPWRGILLYGPPGTGKSFLAKAVATVAKAKFLSVSSADLVSKWLGEGEKLVRTMFELARENKPSIIFLDELDSLCGSRSDNESESARRIKTEFLVQMQGVGNDMDGVLMLGATNLPWSIDSAIRRRFEKRIYVPLPDAEARTGMFRNLMNSPIPHTLVEADYHRLGEATPGYSGSDISIVVRDAIMEPVRKLLWATHFKRVSGLDPRNPQPGVIRNDLYVACAPSDPGAIAMTLMDVPPELLVPPDVTIRDFEKAIERSRPSVNKDDLKAYEKFTAEFGQMGTEEGGE